MRTDIADAILAAMGEGRIDKATAVEFLHVLTHPQPIAVVGLGARTSKTDDYRQVWQTVRAGGSDLGRASLLRGAQVAVAMPPSTCDEPMDLSKGAYFDDPGSFDHDLFGFTEEQSASLMPHAKVVLSAAYRALEDAGHVGEASSAARTGVYVGYNYSKDQIQSFLGLSLRSMAPVDHQEAIFGSWTSGMATRISREFDLRGPAFVLDAACSSSTTAISTACDAIRSGTCDVAVAGGFYLDVAPMRLFNQSGLAMTPDDSCVTKLYDRRNVGMYNGEYAGFAVLKRLDKALADGDRIHGVIHAWAASNNGGDGKFDQNAPNAVTSAVVDLLKSNSIDVEDIGVVMGEGYAHPMEEAMDTLGVLEGLRRFTARQQFVALTALTPNFGYLQSAVGIANLTVMLQMLADREIAALPHFDTPTDLMDLVDSPYYVPTELQEWPEPPSGRRRGFIYTNGFGGANSMLVVGPAPETAPAPDAGDTPAQDRLYCATAPNVAALTSQLVDDLAHLDDNAADIDFSALCYTSAARRHIHDGERIAVLAKDSASLADALRRHLAGEAEVPGVWRGSSSRRRTVRSFAPVGTRSLAECAAAFARGEDIALGSLFPPSARKVVSLPVRRFRETSTWPVPVLFNRFEEHPS